MTGRAILRGWLPAAVVTCALLLGGCADDDGSGSGGAPEAAPAPTTSTTATPTVAFGIGIREETFTDRSRSTPPSGDQPATDERVLETLVFYPAIGGSSDGAVPGLTPATDGGPYPLIVYSHGLGGVPEMAQPVIERWVAAGMVVVAPWFPLSRPDNPAGPDAGDVQNQTGDVSFLIDAMVGASEASDSPLAGLVDGAHVGASGHSNGAITTIGVTADTCCVDERIDAAVAFAGTDSPFAGGEYDFGLAPPFLIVHGTEDQQVDYGSGVALYNHLVGPKGLLALEGGDHGGMFDVAADWFDEVAGATTDFFLAHLAVDDEARARLDASSADSYPSLRYDDGTGAVDLIPTTTQPGIDRRVTVEPTTGLVDGEVVTVTWSGFTPGGSINVVQCSDADEGAGFCDLTAARVLVPNPSGEGTLDIEIVVGPVGEGACGPTVTECVIAVNDSGLTDPDATIYVPLDFAA